MPKKREKFAIGCLLDTNFGPYNQPEPDRDTIKRCVDQLIEEGIIAEQAGFDGVFVQESHMHTETMFPNPLLLLAALATRTERIRLGTYALIPGYGWNPMHLAESTALIDQISGGRLILGVAMGLIEESFRMFGVNSKNRISLFTEAIEVLKQAWTSHEPFNFQGKRYQFDQVFLTPKPYQRDPHPEIWGGAHVDEAIRRVGAFSTGWCSDPFPLQIETWNRQTELFREEAKAHGVEKPQIILMREGFVAETREEAERLCREAFLEEWLYYYDVGILSHHDPTIQSREDVTLDKLRESMIIGSPEDCIEAIERFRDQCRADYLVMRFRCAFGPSGEATKRCMQVFGESVLPHFSE
jgi:alkanesulfonate monooxygenase SsuD/methylene tetrahydromethanopterin reductase-like flavin-dependent oxidoreductase (luciferase family)